jgi:hypothetical protein
VSERVRRFVPGEEIAVELNFVYEGAVNIESVEAVFAREGSGEEIVLLGDARKEPSTEESAVCYNARLRARVEPGAPPGEYRCVRLAVRDRFDDDWNFTARLDLIICVERGPLRLEVVASDFF